MVPAEAEDQDEDAADEADEGDGFAWLKELFASSDAPEDEAEDEAEAAAEFMAERVVLTLGLVDDLSAEVTEGLELGDEVVVLGQSHLRDGARIRTAEEPGEG
jgi:hypothetical protein